MNTGFKGQCVPRYRLLTQEQINEIHSATLKVLDTVGVRVLDNDAIHLLRKAGCTLKDKNTVRIPSRLIEECIKSAPPSITIYNRKGDEAMHLEGHKIHFGLGTDLIRTCDLKTGELRFSCIQDVINAAVTADYLNEIDFIASFGLPRDIPTNLMYTACFRAMVENSIKPIFFTAAGWEDLSIILQMAAVVAGGEDRLRKKPFIINYSEPTSPLSHSSGAIKKLFLCADRGIPINYTPAVLSGASGPVTLAGALAVANAEAISGIVLHQLRAKGAPIISGFNVGPMDILTSSAVYGSPEERLTHSACTDLYHYYGIPVWGTAGTTDSHCLDQQAALEASLSILMAALDGANLIHDVGYLGQGLVGSPAAIVMCAETISYVKRIIDGFEISPDRFGLDTIRRVGPGGSFLAEDQTLNLHRQEHWRPRLLNRDNPEVWMEKGGKTYGEIVIQKAIEILETHTPEPLPEGVCKGLEEIATEAEQVLRDKHFRV